MIEVLLLTNRNSIALHLLPPTSGRVGWREQLATLHRLAADLIEKLTSIGCAAYVDTSNQRILIELSDGEEMFDAVSHTMQVLDEIDCCPYPGVVTRYGHVEIDPDFADEMND